MKTRIVFIGAGYASIWAYKQLCKKSILKKIEEHQLELIVICDRKQHYFHGFTGDTLSGLIPEKAICTPLKKLIPKAKLIYGSALAVSPYTQTVKYRCADGITKEINYHHLVIGSGTQDSQLEKLQDTTFHIKKPRALFHFKKQVQQLLTSNNSQSGDNGENIVLLGSGFTSIEIACNLQEYIKKNSNKPVTISIINSKPDILKEWQTKYPSLVKYANRIIEKKGIQLYNNCSVIQQNEEGLYLSDGTFISTQLVLNATGQKPGSIQGLKHLCLNPQNKIHTNEYLNAEGYTNIWCGGDIALIKQPFSKHHCPPNALWAIMQGGRIGKNLRKTIEGKKPCKFRFPGLGQAAAFGTGKGALELYGIPFRGWPAYLIRLGFFFYFFPAKKRLLQLCWNHYTRKKDEVDTRELYNRETFSEYRELIAQIKL